MLALKKTSTHKQDASLLTMQKFPYKVQKGTKQQYPRTI